MLQSSGTEFVIQNYSSIYWMLATTIKQGKPFSIVRRHAHRPCHTIAARSRRYPAEAAPGARPDPRRPVARRRRLQVDAFANRARPGQPDDRRGLARLANALGIGIGELLSAEKRPVDTIRVLEAHELPTLPGDHAGYTLRILGPMELAGKFEWYELTLVPGANSPRTRTTPAPPST